MPWEVEKIWYRAVNIIRFSSVKSTVIQILRSTTVIITVNDWHQSCRYLTVKVMFFLKSASILGETSKLIGCSLHIQQPAAANLYRKCYTLLFNAAAFWLQPAVMNFDDFPYHLHHNTDLIITGYVHLVYPYGNSDHCWLCPPILWSPSQY